MSKPIKKYNLCIVLRKYTDREGVEKSVWKNIGDMQVWDNGGVSLELYHMPNVRISAFEQKDKKVDNPLEVDPRQPVETVDTDGNPVPAEESTAPIKDGEVKTANIPF